MQILCPRAPSSRRVVPPAPDPAPDDLSLRQIVATIRSNHLRVWSKRAYHEDLVHSRTLGRTSLLLNRPDAIRHVLVDQHENYTRTPATLRILRPLLGQGLLTSAGPTWRHQRRTLAPAFSPKSVDLLVPHMLAPIREAVGELKSSGTEQLDLFAFVHRLALEIAGRTMFSLDMRERGPALWALVARYGERLGRPDLLDLLLPAWMPSPQDLRRALFRRRWVAFIEQIIAERGQLQEKSPRDLLGVLLAARDPESGQAFTPAQVRDQVATMILAGHETTTDALFWAFYLVAIAPEAQERVADEAARVPPDGSSGPQPSRLTYTRAVLDEALRLYPPAFLLVRLARRADRIGDLDIKAGDVLAIAPWVLHRHAKLWEDPAAFVPERFLPGAPAIDRFAYLPFGVGPRICIGAQFALTEAVLVLAEFVRAFRIELAESSPVLPVGAVTTRPDHAPLFRIQKR
jgi:cytochrome P450